MWSWPEGVTWWHHRSHHTALLLGATTHRRTYNSSQTQWNNAILTDSQGFRPQVKYITQIIHSKLLIHTIAINKDRRSHLYNPGHTHGHSYKHTTTDIQTYMSQCHCTTLVTLWLTSYTMAVTHPELQGHCVPQRSMCGTHIKSVTDTTANVHNHWESRTWTES